MTSAVFDASAALAFLLDEPGAERVERALIEGGVMSTINLAEVSQKLSRNAADPARAGLTIGKLSLRYVAVDEELAIAAGALVSRTASKGLSLADRCCLELARRLALPALTADRKWADVADAVGVRVELIR